MLGPLLGWSQPEPSFSRYRALVESYRSGAYMKSARELLSFDPETTSQINDDHAGILDLARPEERRELLGAILLHAEAAALASTTANRRFFLDEARSLSGWLGERRDEVFLKEVRLAVGLRLYRQRRVVDALDVMEPAVLRYRSDPFVQFTYGNLAELVGWLEGSQPRLDMARATYEVGLTLEPENAQVRARLGRVLELRGEHEAAMAHLRAAIETLSDTPHHVVALLALGDALRHTGRRAEAVDAYEAALDLDPHCQAATAALSVVLRQLGQSVRSREVIRDSLDAPVPLGTHDSWMVYRMGVSGEDARLWGKLRAVIQ